MRSSLALAGTAAIASAITLDVSGYSRNDLGYAAINAPVTDQCYTYIQHSTYSDITDAANFDPARCIRDCEETTAYNKQYLNGRASCRFVNTYILLKDGYSQGQICSMYTATWDASYATNTGYTSHDGSVYTICDSYSYSNITDPGVPGQDCVGNPYKPQPPVDPSSTQIPSYPSSTQIPSYPSSTFSTISIPVTTSKPTIVIPTSTLEPTIIVPTSTSLPTVVIPTSTLQPTVIVPTTTSSAPTVVLPPTTVPVVVPTTPATPGAGGQFKCTGLLSSPQCCQVDVLNAASLTCEPPAFSFNSREEFRQICAEEGTTAECCLLPILGQGLVCQEV